MAVVSNGKEQQEGLSQPVRRAISRTVLDLRVALEDDFRKQLTAVGIREDGIHPSPTGRDLSAPDERVRDVAAAVIEREVKGGASKSEALDTFIRDSAFTFLNRVIGLRCLEENGLLIVDGQAETAIKIDPSRNASSLYWRVRNELPHSTSPREVWRETLLRAFSAISQQVKVLFDPESEYATLLPLQATLQQVVEVLNSPAIPSQSYAEDEFLGWVYQYYSSQQKTAVYARLGKGGKIERPDELAAATCLYTERYMVDYLLQNTLGALWLEMHPESKLQGKWPYYVRPPEGSLRANRQARPLRDLTILDPACGSGHFLVRAFDLLVCMYREEEREPKAEIPHLILERNLHGIDIDLRAVQIAALALYIKGCILAGPSFRPRQLNLISADALLPGETPPAEYMARFKGDRELEELVKSIWHGLNNVREFGSLLHPERAVDEVVKRRREEDRHRYPMLQRADSEWALWKADLLTGLRVEFERQSQTEDLGQKLFGKEISKGVSLVEAVGRRYDVVVANPPYAGSRNLNARLKAFLEHEYIDGKQDLYAAFILRCRAFSRQGGYVGMVTQQSWPFLRSFAALRRNTLENTSVETLAQLGPHAFEEIGGEVVKTVLFTLRVAPPSKGHQMTAFRLVGPKAPLEKDVLLQRAISGQASNVVSVVCQSDFLAIPETPFVYWLRPRFFELLRGSRRLSDIADIRQGLATADNERFTRCFWEVAHVGEVLNSKPTPDRWFWYAKGGRYQKWAGLEWLVIDWENGGQRIHEFARSVVRNETYYFRRGLTYSPMGGGNMGARLMVNSVFDVKGASIFPRDPEQSVWSLAALVSNRFSSYLLRVATQHGELHVGYVSALPIPDLKNHPFPGIGRACIALKSLLVAQDPLERTFARLPIERSGERSLVASWQHAEDEVVAMQALLHTLEGMNEQLICEAHGLDSGDIQAILDETGMPSGWNTMVESYDGLPDATHSANVHVEVARFLDAQNRRKLQREDLAQLKGNLRTAFQAGSGSDVDLQTEAADDGEQDDTVLGARIPIPPETFVERLSEKLEIHPISVYWLLREMREQEGLVSPPELRRQMEDYVSVSILRFLGYHWPQQDAHENECGSIVDPQLVDEGGIIPLVACGDEMTAEQRIRMRLESDFGVEGSALSEKEFRQWVGKDIDEWLRKEFFKRQIQQFKRRPIAWHLVSPERTFEVFVLYHKLSRGTLQKLRTQYAGNMIAQLKIEQAHARQRKEDARGRDLQIQIEDVEEFRSRIEAIERGDELKYRIRCRWKGEEQTGRPGPYAPDINDGVKVNIRPFQEAGLLAVKEVIKKW